MGTEPNRLSTLIRRAFWLASVALIVVMLHSASPVKAQEHRFNVPSGSANSHPTLNGQGIVREPLPLSNDQPARAPLEEVIAQPTAGIEADFLRDGEAAFNKQCMQCHDAARSLEKRKSLEDWRSTVQRMATKNDAAIPHTEWEPIAVFLAASSGALTSQAGAGPPSGPSAPPISLFGTVSPTWRGGNSDLQNPGFFPDIWVGATWQPGKAVRARATLCISCHTESGSRIDLAEAAVSLDLTELSGICLANSRATIDAGRLIVPFGAFAAQSNPAIYRTVTKPLIYNMGQRVRDADLGDPVLPMPYSDEGASLNLLLPLIWDANATFDIYLVNGLQGGDDGISFDQSRDYVDNNSQPAGGGRVSIGNQYLRAGGSLMSGCFSDRAGSGPFNQGFSYQLFGLDFIARYDDLVRFQIEYARRNSDRLVSLPDFVLATDVVDGFYAEAEVLLWRQWHLSLLGRFDQQNRSSVAPPPESLLTMSSFRVQRWTCGINMTLAGGSLLMLNVERWLLPGNLDSINVYGVRWAVSF